MPLRLKSRLEKLLLLNPGEIGAISPFFILYLLVFAILTLADGISTSLFVTRVGAEYLPQVYWLTALTNFFAVMIYMPLAEKANSTKLFRWIFVGILMTYIPIAFVDVLASNFADLKGVPSDSFTLIKISYSLPFAARELFYSLALIHFGNYISEHFDRDVLKRILPLSYAGGRLGGFFGALLLRELTPILGVAYLSFCMIPLALAGIYILRRINPPILPPSDAVPSMVDESFVKALFHNPFILWFCISSFVFMWVRWMVQFDHVSMMALHFTGENDFAVFIGNYTLISISIAFVIQALIVPRLIAKWGLSRSHLGYNSLFLSYPILSAVFSPSLYVAVWGRFIENELRFSYRNPLHQMFVNQLPRSLRIQTRSVTLGLINPIATVIASTSISILASLGTLFFPGFVLLLSGTYLYSCRFIYKLQPETTAENPPASK